VPDARSADRGNRRATIMEPPKNAPAT